MHWSMFFCLRKTHAHEGIVRNSLVPLVEWLHNRSVPATLRSLRIRNLALVETLDWELFSGFNVVTGETGTGKSVILGALQLVLGERAEKSLIRAGAEQCSVEAMFELTD